MYTPYSIHPNLLRDLLPVYIQSSCDHLRGYMALRFSFSSLRILSAYLNHTAIRKVVDQKLCVGG